MGNDAKRTSGPWMYNVADPYEIIDDDGDVIAWVPNEPAEVELLMAESRANGRFIVRACTAHDALVEACERALKETMRRDGAACACYQYANGEFYYCPSCQLRAAIALATEEANDEAR